MTQGLLARVGKVERPVSILEVVAGAGGDQVTVQFGGETGGTRRVLDVRRVEGGPWSVIEPATGRSWLVDVETNKDGDPVVEIAGIAAVVKLVDPRLERLAAVAQRARGAVGPEDVRAPMPGKVVKVLVKVGERVAAGQPLIVIEAMKMENELRAPRDGVVAAVHASEGKVVEVQQALVTLDAPAA